MSEDLPRGWTKVRALDVCEAIPNGSTPKAEDMSEAGDVPFIKVYNLTFDGSLDFTKNPTFISRETHDVTLKRSRSRPGDVLMNIVGPPLGKVSIIPDTHPEWNFNQAIVAFQVRRNVLENRFLASYLVHASAKWAAKFSKATVGQHNLAVSDCREIEVPLPPLNEQRRIVAKVEALQARSRRAREALDTAPPLLEKLRQAILAAAFRGDLTKDWRTKNKNVEPASKLIARTEAPTGKSSGRAASTSVLQGVAAISVGNPATTAPRGWEWVPLSRVARMESGHTPSREHADYWGGRIPWIGIKDAREFHGREIPNTAQTVTELGLANSAARLLPAKTVCLSRTASVGYVTIMGKPMATSQDFADWICTSALLPEYLMFALLAEGEHIKKFGEGSTHTTIYFPELKALHICLAPLEEQREIVRRVRTLLDGVERLRIATEQDLERLKTLDRSILAKAFRGELVPQDPNEEPADAMLARFAAKEGKSPAVSGTNGATARRPVQRTRNGKKTRSAREEEEVR